MSPAESHSQECLASARLLMEKIYRRIRRRAQRQLSKHGGGSGAGFDTKAEFRFAEPRQRARRRRILLALKPEYAGDRVFAFGVGLASHGPSWPTTGRRSSTSPTVSIRKKLYNSARNIEIAAWKLANARKGRGEPLLLSKTCRVMCPISPSRREIGKMIAYQDVMAQIAAQRDEPNHSARRAKLATAVFSDLGSHSLRHVIPVW